jgi:hypothetical protein
MTRVTPTRRRRKAGVGYLPVLFSSACRLPDLSFSDFPAVRFMLSLGIRHPDLQTTWVWLVSERRNGSFGRGNLRLGRQLFLRNSGHGNGNEWDELYAFPQIEGQREGGGTSTT